MKRRRILRNLRLDEISGVDVPAQEGAKVAVTKRVSIAKAAVQADDEHQPADATGAARKQSKEPTVTDAEKKALEDRIADLLKSNAELTTTVKRLTAVSMLSPEERGYFERLPEAAQTDAVAKGLVVSVAQAALAADPVIYTALDGTVFRKSAPAQIVEMKKQLDDVSKALAESQNLLLESSVQKQVMTVMKNIAGDDATKCAIVKALNGIKDEAVRKAAFDLIAKADGGAELLQGRHSHGGGGPTEPTSAEQQFEALVKRVMEANPGVSREDASAYAQTQDADGRVLFKMMLAEQDARILNPRA